MSDKQPNSRYCFVCGVENPLGLHLKFYNTAPGEVTADVILPEQYQGYPGIVHGGIIASMLDEAAGRSHMGESDAPRFMFTARLEINYRKNVPTEKPLRLVGRAGESKKRTAAAASFIYGPDGSLLAESEALLVNVPNEMFENADLEEIGWKVYPDEVVSKMIIEYNRPNTLEEALTALQRSQPRTLPLAGGTALVRPSPEAVAVVDLQALGLNRIQTSGNTLILGATLTLQELLDWLTGEGASLAGMAPALAAVIEHEASYNLRQAGTVAGMLVAADGRSPFATAMVALDGDAVLEPGGEALNLGDLLPARTRSERLEQRLITQVSLPSNISLRYEYVARTPADQPIVCVAAARWPSGRTRIALGGFGSAPTLAMDGPESDGAETAAASAYSQAEDQWATAAYRSQAAGTLARRCLGGTAA